MPTMIVLRHGESTWNAENRFTGWTDVDLSEKGEAEARSAGQLLAEETELRIDTVHTSVLTRGCARRTSPSTRWGSRSSRYAGTGASTSATTAPCRAGTRRRRLRIRP